MISKTRMCGDYKFISSADHSFLVLQRPLKRGDEGYQEKYIRVPIVGLCKCLMDYMLVAEQGKSFEEVKTLYSAVTVIN